MKSISSARADTRDLFAAVDARDFLQTYLHELSPADQAALTSIQRGETLEDAARQDDITAAAVHYRRQSAMRRFRELVEAGA